MGNQSGFDANGNRLTGPWRGQHPLSEERIPLGVLVKDRITGYHGITVQRVRYLTGRVDIGVQARSLDKDGKVRAVEYFPEGLLDISPLNEAIVMP